MERRLSQEELVARLDGWARCEVAIRVVFQGDELLAVFRGQLGERSSEKEPALFWPLVRDVHPEDVERPGIYLHPGRFEGAVVHKGEFVLELVQAGVTLNLRLL